MKRKTTFSLLCLTWMVLLSLGVFDVHAQSESDLCATERKAADDAAATYLAARTRYYTALKAQFEYVKWPIPSWLEEAANPKTVLEKTKEGVVHGLPSGINGLLSALEAPALVEEYNDALRAVTKAYSASYEANVALDLCMGEKYHRCIGCDTLIGSEGMTGHRSLLCAAQHTYYECSPAALYMHTTSLKCRTGEHTVLACQMDTHKHITRCPGCNREYDAHLDVEADEHRIRICNELIASTR